MANENTESDELGKLLADVQRTIRENEQFIRHLKEEAADSNGEEAEEEQNDDAEAVDEGFEEL